MSARSVAFLSTLALAAMLPAAWSMPTTAQIAKAFTLLDTSQNAAISPAEWKRASFALFQAADKNNNDFIDAEELKGSSIAQDTFLRADLNRDGRLSVDEYMELRRELFAVADLDHDDYLTFVEYELFIVFESVGWHDRNANGRMEVSELRVSLTAVFEQLDANHDGQLDKAETTYMEPKPLHPIRQERGRPTQSGRTRRRLPPRIRGLVARAMKLCGDTGGPGTPCAANRWAQSPVPWPRGGPFSAFRASHRTA